MLKELINVARELMKDGEISHDEAMRYLRVYYLRNVRPNL
ncbi:UNVERIFIED_ORG: hypothetical protein QIH99_gp70 [Proteus phage VB_PmiS-Isfahan]|uniref:Uncharacterized protein n=1 Tax=Proteus phage VB_PmiS-Isfahan TaxID=1969841 RepID=A0A1U9ZA83_9CAUD